MRDAHTVEVGERIFALIEADFDSDVAFERAAGLPEKTVNNWRRGRSSSYMKRLPMLAELFRVPMTELLGVPEGEERAELSEEEWRLVHLYRKTRTLSRERREALWQTLSSVVTLYLNGPRHREGAVRPGERRTRKKPKSE